MSVTTLAITPGVGGPVAVDLIGGSNYQLVKLAHGSAGVATVLEAAAPLPIGPGLKTSEQLTRTVINCAVSGANTIVAASAANFFRLYAIILTVAASVTVTLGDTAAWTGAMTFGAGGGILLTNQGEPHYISSAVNKAFVITLGSAVQCSGTVWYTLAP